MGAWQKREYEAQRVRALVYAERGIFETIVTCLRACHNSPFILLFSFVLRYAFDDGPLA